MAKQVVVVRECDRCGTQPALLWKITGPEGVVSEIDLCDRHAAPIANAYALGRTVTVQTRRAPRRRNISPPPPPPPPVPEPQWR